MVGGRNGAKLYGSIIDYDENLLKIHGTTTEEIEKKISSMLPDKFGIIIDGWLEGSEHFLSFLLLILNTEILKTVYGDKHK